MSAAKLNKVSVDASLFRRAFDRDVDFHDTCSQTAYLDMDNGLVEWLYADDEDAESEAGPQVAADNRVLRRQLTESPRRFLEIPGRSHGEHHELLREFLSSPWTDNESLRQAASLAYAGSIGGWIKTVDDAETVQAYYAFRDTRLKEMADAFLESHGIQPDWK